ncbi:HNH endonuclease [Nocardia flavorosea]|uniref:HNH endonuclease n=1 Tax=Nocardia flavorosea TaxID=53429 RepID=UPI003CC808C9
MGWDSGNRARPTGWARLRARTYYRDGRQCVGCGRALKLTEARCDHIVPWSKGGTDELSNLQTLCVPCHNAKSADETRKRMRTGEPRRPVDRERPDGWWSNLGDTSWRQR